MLSITRTQIVQNLWFSERSKAYANDRQAAKESGVVDGIELALRKLSIPLRIIQHFCEYIGRIGKSFHFRHDVTPLHSVTGRTDSRKEPLYRHEYHCRVVGASSSQSGMITPGVLQHADGSRPPFAS